MSVNSLVFELVGPAGVGKTALLHAIAELSPVVRTGVRIDRIRQLPAVAWGMVALTPAIVDMLFADVRWLWPGMRHLGRLRTLPAAVGGARASSHQVILLDEGPIYSLGRLRVFQHADIGTGAMARQWRGEVDRWSRLLNGIVLLDARNEVLVERIRQRPKAHQIKNGSDAEMFEFLDRYRAAYRDIASRLTAAGGVQIVELDTTTAPIAQIATDTVNALTRRGVRSAATAAPRGP